MRCDIGSEYLLHRKCIVLFRHECVCQRLDNAFRQRRRLFVNDIINQEVGTIRFGLGRTYDSVVHIAHCSSRNNDPDSCYRNHACKPNYRDIYVSFNRTYPHGNHDGFGRMGKCRQELDKTAFGTFFSGVLYRCGTCHIQNAVQQHDNFPECQFGRGYYANGDAYGLHGGTYLHSTENRCSEQVNF